MSSTTATLSLVGLGTRSAMLNLSIAGVLPVQDQEVDLPTSRVPTQAIPPRMADISDDEGGPIIPPRMAQISHDKEGLALHPCRAEMNYYEESLVFPPPPIFIECARGGLERCTRFSADPRRNTVADQGNSERRANLFAVTVKKGFLLIIQKIVPIPANIRLATSATIVLSIVTVTLRKMCNVTFVAQREGIEQK